MAILLIVPGPDITLGSEIDDRRSDTATFHTGYDDGTVISDIQAFQIPLSGPDTDPSLHHRRGSVFHAGPDTGYGGCTDRIGRDPSGVLPGLKNRYQGIKKAFGYQSPKAFLFWWAT